jgi:hypothetical protein
MYQAVLLQRDINFKIKFHANRQILGIVPYSDWCLLVQSKWQFLPLHNHGNVPNYLQATM